MCSYNIQLFCEVLSVNICVTFCLVHCPLTMHRLHSILFVCCPKFLHSQGKKELNMKTVQTTRVGIKDQNKGLFSIWQEIFQLPKVQR